MDFRFPTTNEFFYGSASEDESHSTHDDHHSRYPSYPSAYPPPPGYQDRIMDSSHHGHASAPPSFGIDHDGNVRTIGYSPSRDMPTRYMPPPPVRIPQGHPSAQHSGLRVDPEIACQLPRPAEFIRGTNVAVTPRARDCYRELRAAVQRLPTGRHNIDTLEHPPQRSNDVTVLTTHMVNPEHLFVAQPFFRPDQSVQVLVSFAPDQAAVLSTGEVQSAMVSCYHELTHAVDYLELPNSQLARPWFHEPDQVFPNQGEHSAVSEENRLAHLLGQGARQGYDPGLRVQATSFSSATLADPRIAELASLVRSGRMDWEELQELVQ